MDRVWDLLTEVKGRFPKNILEVQIPEKFKNPPLWLKVSLGTGALSYAYIRYSWTAMNDWGIPVLSPYLMTFGSSGHYARANGIVELADEELRKKNRKTIGFYRLLSPVVFTIDLDVLIPIFTTHFGSFTNRQPDIGSFGMGKELSKTIDVITDAKRWRRIRQSVSPSFSNVQLEKMMSVSKERLDVLVKQIAALKGESINARSVTGKYTMDGFLSAALGFEMQLDSLRDFEKQQEFIHMNDILNPGPQIFLLFIFPGLGAFLDRIGVKLYAPKAAEWFTGYCKAMIAAETPETDQRNFLSAFKKLRISDEEAESATKGLTEDEIISQVFVLFGAGYETSASLLQWAVYNICKDGDLQQRLFEEVKDVPEEYENLNAKKLPLLTAILNECLRLFSPAIFQFRYCEHDVVINGIPFRKGSNIEVPIDYLHEAEEYWGEDALEFSPDRWIKNPELEKAPFFIPFGVGPRNCVGMRFANMQSRLGLMRIVKNFNMQFPDDFTDDVKKIRTVAFLAVPSKEIQVSFRPR